MRTAGPGTSSPVSWGLRRYWPVVTAAVLVMVLAVPWALQASQREYQATALVVAKITEMPEESLPRYAEAVFASGPVVARVAAVLGVPPDPTELVPAKLSLTTAQNSVVLVVNGFDRDPEVARRIADEASEAYLLELNRPGPELAVFTLQSPATAPLQPVDEGPGLLVTALVGGLAGVALGVGLVLLLLNVRRPVLSEQDYRDVTGAPVLARLRLPAHVPPDLEPRSVLGIAPLVHALAQLDQSSLSVLAPEGDAEQRRAVARLVERVRASRPVRPGQAARPGRAVQPAVVDVADPVEGLQSDAPPSALLVVREGSSERAVLRTLAQYPAHDVVGVVVVKVERGLLAAPLKRPLHRVSDSGHDDGATAPRAAEDETPPAEDRTPAIGEARDERSVPEAAR